MGEVIVTSGQIGLVPGSMRLVEGGARRQSALALRHVARVLRASARRGHVRAALHTACYLTRAGGVPDARRVLERRTAGALAQYVVVEALPRAAHTEWAVWAHTDNCRFECEIIKS